MDEKPDVDHQFSERYKIKETLQVIRDGGYKVIALQFPDDILCECDKVIDHLSQGCKSEFYVLGDTTFGSCCVDEVAARHVDADFIVHYGKACLSRPKRIPCYYVIHNMEVVYKKCIDTFKNMYSRDDEVFIISPPYYQECASKITSILVTEGYTNINCIKIPLGLALPSQREINFTGHNLPPDSKIFYIGPDGLHLFNVLITNARSDIYWFDSGASSCQKVSSVTSKTLQQRYFQMESARNARVFGIVIGTLGQSSSLNVLNYVKNIIREHNRRYYVIAVGKPNPQKLGNFPEIDCFVLLACPECSFLTSRDYYRPIITVYELLVALESLELDLRYIISVQQVMETLKVDGSPGKDADAVVNSSLSAPLSSSIGEKKSLERSNKCKAYLSKRVDTAAEFLSRRTYKGLEYDGGEKEAVLVKDGKSGCASGYDNELF